MPENDIATARVREAEGDLYSAILELLVERERKEPSIDFHGTLCVHRTDLEKVLLFDTTVDYSTFRQKFEDEGKPHPWMLVIVGSGDVCEYLCEVDGER